MVLIPQTRLIHFPPVKYQKKMSQRIEVKHSQSITILHRQKQVLNNCHSSFQYIGSETKTRSSHRVFLSDYILPACCTFYMGVCTFQSDLVSSLEVTNSQRTHILDQFQRLHYMDYTQIFHSKNILFAWKGILLVLVGIVF